MAGNVQEMLSALAEQGLKVMFVAYPDACRACRKLQGRTFDPMEAPPIPVKDCLTPPCRCRYEGYDPRAVIARLLTAGVDAAKEQRLEDAKELLHQVIDLDDRNEKAWLWLSGAVVGIDERIVCLENVLTINPHHELAREGLRHLLAQRRELGAGREAAKKIKEAKEAIDHLKASQTRVMTLKETPPVPTMPPTAKASGRPSARRPTVKEPMGEQRPPTSFAMVFLYVLLAVLILILVLAALTYAGILLR